MSYTKKVVIIGTGGTIAGQGKSESDLTGYRAGAMYLEDILNSIPSLGEYGPYKTVDYCHIDSSDISLAQWSELATIIDQWAERDDVEGIVVTHGTDTMEETAYFLHLVLKTEKPVIMTGAMRPASALSADGPLNLLSAIQAARTPESAGKGVIVLLNGYLDSARDVVKTNTTDVATFSSQMFGHMGIMQDGKAHYYYAPARPHTSKSIFHNIHSRMMQELPRVDVIYLYAGMTPDVIQAVLGLHPKGLVLGGMGHGVIPQNILPIVSRLHIPIVRASRTGSGKVSRSEYDNEHRFIVSDTLPPTKARVLLMLGLALTDDTETLQEWFHTY